MCHKEKEENTLRFTGQKDDSGESIAPFLVLLRGFAAMRSPPSETGMTSALQGASFQGLGAENQYPALNRRSEAQGERPRLRRPSWRRRVCVNGTVFVDSAHY